MEKTKAIAYRDFIIEAEKAFYRIYLHEAGLTSTEVRKLKERYSSEQFDKIFFDFINELTNNIIKYDDTSFVKAYLKSVFNSACGKVDRNSTIPQQIITRDFEIEFLLMLWKTVNEAYDYFDYFCEKTDTLNLYVPLYKYFDDLKKEKNAEKNEQKEDESNNINHQYNPRFDFNTLKTEIENTELTPNDKYNLVNDRLHDFLQWQKQYDVYDELYVSWGSSNESKYEITRKLYPNFEKLCKMEMDRWKNVINQNNTSIKKESGNNKVRANYRIASKRKTDVVKILSAMYDCRMFVDAQGKPVTNKQELMEAFGEFLGEDFKAYSTLLSQAKDKDRATFLRPFDEITSAIKKYYQE